MSPVSPDAGFFDKQFGNTSIILLVLFAFCCSGICLPLPLGIVGLIVCKDPTAKRNAMIVTIISGIMTVLIIIANVAKMAMGDGK